MFVVEFEGFNDGLWRPLMEGYQACHDTLEEAENTQNLYREHFRKIRTRIIKEYSVLPPLNLR